MAIEEGNFMRIPGSTQEHEDAHLSMSKPIPSLTFLVK